MPDRMVDTTPDPISTAPVNSNMAVGWLGQQGGSAGWFTWGRCTWLWQAECPCAVAMSTAQRRRYMLPDALPGKLRSRRSAAQRPPGHARGGRRLHAHATNNACFIVSALAPTEGAKALATSCAMAAVSGGQCGWQGWQRAAATACGQGLARPARCNQLQLTLAPTPKPTTRLSTMAHTNTATSRAELCGLAGQSSH